MRSRLLFLILSFFLIPFHSAHSTHGDSEIRATSEPVRILIFSKTDGFRHASIEPAIEIVRRMGDVYGFEVDATEDSDWFTEERLNRYDAVFFLNTSMTLFNDDQREVFEKYIRSGGGYVGTHSAADTEYDWPFYGTLVGAWFKNHPQVQEGEIVVKSHSHPATSVMPPRWTITDEWYNFRQLPEGVTVLAELNTESIEGSEHPGYHPASWYHTMDQGRAFYTVLGHSETTWKNPHFKNQILGAIRYVTGVSEAP
ncbi:MAG: ThuA domain-containing protein [Bacteroidota bacterium]